MTERVIVCTIVEGVAELWEPTRSGAASFAKLKIPKDWTVDNALRWAFGTVELLAPSTNGDVVPRSAAVKAADTSARRMWPQRELLDFLAKHGPMTSRELAAATDGRNTSTVLARCRRAGLAKKDAQERWSVLPKHSESLRGRREPSGGTPQPAMSRSRAAPGVTTAADTLILLAQGGLTTAELRERTGMTVKQASNRVTYLSSQGLIRNDGGTWRVVD